MAPAITALGKVSLVGGTGTYVSSDGQEVTGAWKNGCFRIGRREFAVAGGVGRKLSVMPATLVRYAAAIRPPLQRGSLQAAENNRFKTSADSLKDRPIVHRRLTSPMQSWSFAPVLPRRRRPGSSRFTTGRGARPGLRSRPPCNEALVRMKVMMRQLVFPTPERRRPQGKESRP